MSDALAVASWWLIVQLFGLAAWPLAFRLFRWLPDRGYMLAKPLGLLLVSYVLWLLVSIQILPNVPLGILIALIIVFIISQWVYRRSQPSTSNLHLFDWLRDHRALVIAYELIFALAFIGWAIFRAHVPDISSGEKSMELAFFNAVGRSATFPPHDPWFSGYSISYYYFGYVMMSLFSKLSGVTSGVAFSLSNALWFALTAAGAFAVVANLILLTARQVKVAIVFSVLGTVLLTLMGNLEAPLDVAYSKGWGAPEMWSWIDILDLNQPRAPAMNDQPAWLPRGVWDWWWRAARLIHDYPPTSISPALATVLGTSVDPNAVGQDVVNEFPQFSFLLGDLHPHNLNLPFVLLMIGLTLNVYQAGVNTEADSMWRGKQRMPLWLLYPLILGSLGFTNTWDLPIYLLLVMAALALGQWQTHRLKLWSCLGDLAMVGVLSLGLYLPYHLSQSISLQVSGIAPDLFNGTRLIYFFLMFGPFIIIGLLFGAVLLGHAIQTGRSRLRLFAAQSLGGGLAITVALAVAMTILAMIVFRPSAPLHAWFEDLRVAMAQHGITLEAHLLARLTDPWVILGLTIALAAIPFLWQAARPLQTVRQSTGDQEPRQQIASFALLLFFIGVLLVLSVDVVFVVDYFKTRSNSAFKFYYQAWVLWSVASAYALYYLLTGSARIQSRSRRWLAGLTAGGMICLGLVYPALAIPSRIDYQAKPGLDAILATVVDSAPDSNVRDAYAATLWLNENVAGAPIILEGTTDQLPHESGQSRISAWTGLPTLLGWPDHEVQWRGSEDIIRQRLADITTIYSTPDIALARSLLQKYSVNYVIVSDRERIQYPQVGLAKFAQMFPIVFQQNDVIIYRIP